MISLQRRLMVAAAFALSAALTLAGFGLTYVFETTVRARVVADISDNIDVLLQGLQIQSGGDLVLRRQPADPRFERPYGGFYWQVGRADGTLVRSRSLWEASLAWRDSPPRFGQTRSGIMRGPSAQELVFAERIMMVDGPDGAVPIRFMVALDDNELVEARTAFFGAVIPSLAALGGALLLGLWIFLRFGLAPLGQLKQSLAEIRANRSQRIEGDYPTEIMALVEEANALIAARTEDMIKARARAGDLAHALKTPLAVLSAKARTLRASGQIDAADDVSEEVERLQVIVRRELLRARASLHAVRNVYSTPLKPSVEKVCRAVQRIAGEDKVNFAIDVPDGLTALVNETDLMEMIGNLIENSAKWANTRVQVSARHEASAMVSITVADDGPGMSEPDIVEALKPGVRLDEQKPGHGFGLGIARELAEAYGGEFAISRSDEGGLVATLLLPEGS